MNLLERTRRLLEGLTPPSSARVQYYNVACPEGHRLQGERTEGYQALRCPTCGEGIFVLPRSPLPDPPPPEAARRARPEPRAEVVPDFPTREDEPIQLTDPAPATPAAEPVFDGEIEWMEPGQRPATVQDAGVAVDEVPIEWEEPAAPAAVRERARAAQTEPATDPRKPPRPPGKKRPQVPLAVAVPLRETARQWLVRRRNPLIFLAVGMLVAGTVGYRLWRSKFQDFPRIAEVGRTRGLEALDAGDFDTAHQLLSEAKRAVDSLGGAVEGAAEIRHGAEEAALFTSECPDSLETILANASPDPDEFESRFATMYKGRAVLFDADVVAVPSASGSGRYELSYLVFPPGEAARPSRTGFIDLTGFKLFESTQPRKGDHVLFGARLASFRYENGLWLIGLEPDSGVFLTHPRALEARGFPSSDESVGDEP